MNRNVDPAKKNEQALQDLLKVESNKYCADCGQKGTRWASWNIGVFLCIRCGGLHRSLGTHISKVKSVTLDKWTDEQIESIKSKGNFKVNMLYNPSADKHPFPTFSGDMENYIRDKYERKLFMAEGASGHMSLNSDSVKSSGKNIMDSDFGFESRKAESNDFKSSNNFEAAESNYSKQLALLSEMGFTDTEFNYKTLKAANGNMQEALEIIVAANHKPRRKTVEKNLFDELDDKVASNLHPAAHAAGQHSAPVNNGYKSPPPIQLDDWGTTTETKTPSNDLVDALMHQESEEIEDTKPEPVIEKKSHSSNNPWDNDDEDDLTSSTENKKSDDPFDSFKAFRSTTSDTYFDNPW